MNILQISPYVPNKNAFHAGGVMMAKEYESLSKKHSVYLMSFINNKSDKEYAKEFNPKNSFFVNSGVLEKCYNAILHFYMPTLFAIRNSRRFKKNLIKKIEEWKIDAIHAEYTSMGQYYWVKKKFPNIKFNIVEHDVTYQSYLRKNKNSFTGRQSGLIKRYEKRFLDNADNIFVLSKKDYDFLTDNYDFNLKTHIICPYYGLEHFKTIGNFSNKTICFIGNMGRMENDLAAKRLINIFNEININKCCLKIIGANPSKELLSSAKDNIEITGFVKNLEEAVRGSSLAVFPLDYGAGVKFKVLQALGFGLPVITTEIGAEGIDENGEVIILARTNKDFVQKIRELIDKPSSLRKLSIRGINWSKKNFDWNVSEKIFSEIYSEE